MHSPSSCQTQSRPAIVLLHLSNSASPPSQISISTRDSWWSRPSSPQIIDLSSLTVLTCRPARSRRRTALCSRRTCRRKLLQVLAIQILTAQTELGDDSGEDQMSFPNDEVLTVIDNEATMQRFYTITSTELQEKFLELDEYL